MDIYIYIYIIDWKMVEVPKYIYIMIFVGEDFVLGHPQACLSVFGNLARTVLSLSDMGRL